MLEFLKIIALTTLAAVLYGICHDMITTRICLEYFTVFHPPIFGGTTDPNLLALGWGVIATWWVGLPLGILLAIFARVGGLPKLTARQLLKPLAVTLIVLAIIAASAGFLGYSLTGAIPITGRPLLAPEKMPGLNADGFAHLASYFFGAILGLVLSIATLVKRYRLANALRAASTISLSAD